MSIEYLKGSDNKVTDALSQIQTRLDPEIVTELLNHAKGGMPHAETKDIQVVEVRGMSRSGGYPLGTPAGETRQEVS